MSNITFDDFCIFAKEYGLENITKREYEEHAKNKTWKDMTGIQRIKNERRYIGNRIEKLNRITMKDILSKNFNWKLTMSNDWFETNNVEG